MLAFSLWRGRVSDAPLNVRCGRSRRRGGRWPSVASDGGSVVRGRTMNGLAPSFVRTRLPPGLGRRNAGRRPQSAPLDRHGHEVLAPVRPWFGSDDASSGRHIRRRPRHLQQDPEPQPGRLHRRLRERANQQPETAHVHGGAVEPRAAWSPELHRRSDVVPVCLPAVVGGLRRLRLGDGPRQLRECRLGSGCPFADHVCQSRQRG